MFTQKQVDAMIAAKLEEQKKLLEAKRSATHAIGMKVSDKGAVSVYGIGRFPVTLYGSQWERLFSEADKVKAFLKENADKLAVKGGMVAS